MPILTIQPSDIDTFLNLGIPDDPDAGNIYLRIWAQEDDKRRSLLKFDFSALPVGAIISAAELDLYYYFYTYLDPVGRTYWAYELTQTGWVEMEASWNHYKAGEAFHWSVAGGDYTIVNGASLAVPAAYGWMSWNVLVLVQHFQSVHAKVAHFLMRDGAEEANRDALFYSRRYTTDPTKCPKLIITYTVPRGSIMIF